jgi:predicted RNA-binding Zn-ribbon protein involved in translation (DUF1610 family)
MNGKGEKMRLIDADAFKEYITEACEDLAPLFNDNGKVARLVTENFCKDIDEQPTVSAEPKRIRGKWIYGEDSMADCVDGYRCDKCGFFVPWDYQHKSIDYIKDYNFCPNCGEKKEVEHDG